MRMLESSMDNFVAVDIETTGLNPRTEKIIEIGAVRVRSGRIEGEFTTFVQPEKKVSSFITELTGITDAMLDGVPKKESALRAFFDFARQDTLLGHNISFDYSFLKKNIEEIGEKFVRKGIDTLKIARKLLPDLEDRSLTNLCHYYQIENTHAHRAKEDAIAAFQLYSRLKKEYDNHIETTKLFYPAPLYCRIKKDSPATAAQLKYLKALLAYHGLSTEMIAADFAKSTENDKWTNYKDLTKREASRQIDKIILIYGKIPR